MRRVLRLLRFLLVRTFYLLLKRPIVTLSVALLLGILAVLQLPNLRASMEFDGFMDPTAASVRNEQELKRLFKQKNPLFIVLKRQDFLPLSQKDLCVIDEWIRSEKRTNVFVESVVTPFDLRKPSWNGTQLWYMRWVSDACVTGNSPDLLADGAPLKVLNFSPWKNIFADTNGRDFLFEVNFRNPNADVDAAFNPLVMSGFIERLSLLEQSGLQNHLAGRSSFQWYFREANDKDRIIGNSLLLVAMLVCVRVFLGRWRGGLILVGSLLFMAVLLFGSMAAVGHPVDLISNSLFSIVAIAVIEDFFFLAYRRIIAPNESWRVTFSKLILPCFLTSFTTIIGFGSLCFGDLATIQRLGLWAAFGAFLEWMIIFFVVPSLIKVFPWAQIFTDGKRVRVLQFFQNAVHGKISKWAVFACLALIPFGFLSSFFLHPADDYKSVFPSSHPIQTSLQYLEKSRGWVGDASLVFAKDANERFAQALIREVEQLPSVVQVQNPWAILDAMTSKLPVEVAELVRADFRSSVFDDRFFAKSGEALVPVYMRASDMESYRSLRILVDKTCPNRECFLAGPMTTYEEISTKLVPTLLESCAVSLGLVSGILLLLCFAQGVPRYAVRVIVSSMWCSFVMMLALAVSGIQINYLACIFAAILVGIAGDNAIIYLLSSDRSKLGLGLTSLGPASIFISFTSMACASVLFLSSLQPPRTLATLFVAGLALNLFGDLWLLRGMLSKDEN